MVDGDRTYFGWDETGAYTVAVSTNRQEVVEAMIKYGEELKLYNKRIDSEKV
jgi:hypothetical protein